MKMRNTSKTEHVKKIKINKGTEKISKLKITILLLILTRITRKHLMTVRKIMRTRELVIKTIMIIVIIMN